MTARRHGASLVNADIDRYDTTRTDRTLPKSRSIVVSGEVDMTHTPVICVHVQNDADAILAAVAELKGAFMSELDDLKAAVAASAAAFEVHAAEQATVLKDFADRLAAAIAQAGGTPGGGVDPALLAPITKDINDQVAKLQALTAAEVAADPGPVAAPAAAAPAEAAPADAPVDAAPADAPTADAPAPGAAPAA